MYWICICSTWVVTNSMIRKVYAETGLQWQHNKCWEDYTGYCESVLEMLMKWRLSLYREVKAHGYAHRIHSQFISVDEMFLERQLLVKWGIFWKVAVLRQILNLFLFQFFPWFQYLYLRWPAEVFFSISWRKKREKNSTGREHRKHPCKFKLPLHIFTVKASQWRESSKKSYNWSPTENTRSASLFKSLTAHSFRVSKRTCHRLGSKCDGIMEG